MISESAAVRAYPELAQLAAIRDAGWRFRLFRGEQGDLAGIVGWHSIREATDALWIFDRSACRAVRLLADAPAARGGIVWDHSGDLVSCLGELLGLPEPGQPGAPTLIRAAAPMLWTP